MRILILSAISIILLLSGCASGVDIVETRSQEVERTHLNLPAADPLDLDEYEWFVITPDNAEELFEYLKRKGDNPVIFGLTDRGYEKLSIDFAKIRQHINTQRNILLQYKEYYEDTSPPSSSNQ
jgi:hypothetical protein